MASEACSHEELRDSGVVCPECGTATIVPTRGRFGPIWTCAARPACGFWMRARPTGSTCGFRRDERTCGALMMEGTKTIPDRCSERDCPNHKPASR